MHLPRLLLRGLAVASLATALTAQIEVRPAAVPFERALARYQACLHRRPFLFHTEGRSLLAATRDPRALAQLADDYARAKEYPEYARYTIATLLARHFDAPPFRADLQRLAEAHRKPIDAWLQIELLALFAGQDDGTAALHVATADPDAILRAAAIAALGMVRADAAFAAIAHNCAAFPAKERDADRMLVLGAMSGALLQLRDHAWQPDARAGVLAYIDLLEPDRELSAAARQQVARHLQWTLDGPGPLTDPAAWRTILAQGSRAVPTMGTTVVLPRFFGIESEAEHVCYAIDLSDSMCQRLDPVLRPAEGAAASDPDALPWADIHTRFDLVRAHLQASLRRLRPEVSFAVVWFGSDTGTLDATPGLVRATPANVQRACRELDAIQPGPPSDIAPYGTLRGNTNLQGGLRRALSLTARGFVERAAYVAAGPLTEGCDTLFVLSDGAPSWDDFAVEDRNFGEHPTVTGAEFEGKRADTDRIDYYGPYDDADWLLTDLRRANAFRRVRIHCVAMGEANTDLLRDIAAIGHGELLLVARPVAAPAAKAPR